MATSTHLKIAVATSMMIAALVSSGVRLKGQRAAAPATICPRCAWQAPATATVVKVSTVAELKNAVASARPDTTILLADGEYRLDRMLDIPKPHIVLRGASGVPARVVIRGGGMTESKVGVALSISASDVTIADLTVGMVGYHGIQVRGERGASRLMVHNVRVVDTGQQLIKGSTDARGLFADDGVVACSTLEYTNTAPSDYTNGIDIIAGAGWVVRDNILRRIVGPAAKNYTAGPAILFWGNSQRTIIERNLVVDSFRGIALGLGPGASQRSRNAERGFDHQEGWIRNNVVVNYNAWGDEGIEVSAARATRIEHNTVLTEGKLPWSISVRFGLSDALVRNNLTTRPVTQRNGGNATLAGNVGSAARTWFTDIARSDFGLARPDVPAVDAGVVIPDLVDDFARRPRRAGRAPDAGALERQP